MIIVCIRYLLLPSGDHSFDRTKCSSDLATVHSQIIDSASQLASPDEIKKRNCRIVCLCLEFRCMSELPFGSVAIAAPSDCRLLQAGRFLFTMPFMHNLV